MDSRGRVRVEAGPQAGAGHAGRGGGGRHHRCGLRLGEPVVPAVLHPAGRRRPRRAEGDGDDQPVPQPGKRHALLRPRRRHGGGGRRLVLRRLADRGPAGPGPLRLVGDGRLVRGGRGGLRPSPQPLHPGRLSCGPPARSASRSTARSWPRPPTRRSCSRPGSPAGPTSPSSTSAWSCSTPPTRPRCAPTKGTARYWSVRAGGKLHPDLAWSYDAPFRESAPIAGLVAFFDEKVDVFVDGEQQARPKTVFS